MTKLSRLLPCFALGLATTSVSAQIFSGSGSASGEVTPGTPSSASFNSSYPVFPQDGSLPGSTSGSALFTATGVSAVGSASGSYSAASGWPGLSVSANSGSSYPAVAPNTSFGDFFNFGATGNANVHTTLNVTDLVFSGPSAAIPVSLNLLFSSAVNASALGGSVASYGASGFSISLNGASTFSGEFAGNFHIYNSQAPSGNGLLSGYAGGLASLESGIWAAPTGTPLTLSISLYGNASAQGLYDTSASSDATATLALPTGGPLFNLPVGFTADSPSLQLANNVYAPVPEPGHYAALAGLGLLGFAFWRRARR